MVTVVDINLYSKALTFHPVAAVIDVEYFMMKKHKKKQHHRGIIISKLAVLLSCIE
jgi:hypothetical protein